MKRELKYFYLLQILLMVSTGFVFPQSGWIRQYPPPEAQNTSFLSVSFTDAQNGFIVGGSGTIIHTTNGGTDWISQLSGTANWLRGISAADANTAVAVGDSGIILHTINSGEKWERQSSGTVYSLRAVSFTDANTAVAVGDSGIILHTINSGEKWERQSSGTFYNLRSVSFIDVNIGTVVGDSGTVLCTTNGGTTWINRSISADYRLCAVSFPDTDTGVAVGIYQHYPCVTPCYDNGPRILRTTNGGVSWKNETPNWDSIAAFCTQCYPDVIFGVSFTDANTGTVVLYNQVFHTTNGGGVLYTDSVKEGEGYWTRQLVDSNNFHGVCLTDANTGTVVGVNGTIFHTTTGGVTSIKDNPIQLPEQFALEQNYPNPFNPSTVISYRLPISSHVIIKVFDVLGREVQTIVNEHQSAGNHSVTFRASNLPSGVYLYRIQATPNNGKVGVFSETKKLLFLK
jgi:photosystem II stability/assembly factor-like uncharacterized protein